VAPKALAVVSKSAPQKENARGFRRTVSTLIHPWLPAFLRLMVAKLLHTGEPRPDNFSKQQLIDLLESLSPALVSCQLSNHHPIVNS
jgi:hypothetical protein